MPLGGCNRRWSAARRPQLVLLAAVLAAAALPAGASATTFAPTTTADGDNAGVCTPALCTLRDAVNAASAAPGNDVSIPAGAYTLNLGELLIAQSMTVAGAGARTTTIDAQGTSRVLDVNVGDEATIRDLTVTGGATSAPGPEPLAGEGGGIVVQGILHLRSAAVVGNTANFTGGGISAPFKGGATLVTIDDSLIANNHVAGGLGAGSGGGVQILADSATITNTTITGNSTSNPGDNQGGGLTSSSNFIPPSPATLTLVNTTIAGNSISGSGTNFGAGLAGNNLIGFGITPSVLTARNTIIAGNTVNGGTRDCELLQASSTAFNLSSDASCGFTDAGSKQNGNPQLGALANNGGPTDTRAIGDGSPALNAGTNAGCPAADQRGTSRPQAAICDIGAVELKAPDLEVKQSFVKRKGKRKRGRSLASVAKVRRGKSLTFIATVTNKGEQTAPGTQLTVKLPKKTSKVKLNGCESTPQKKTKKRKKGKRRRGKKMFGCSLGNVAPGASKEVQIKFRPKRGGKLVSKVSVQSQIADANPATDTARNQIRIKRIKRRR